MDCKLIVIDLDGTLNNDQKRITEKSQATLLAAQERGLCLDLASVRPWGLYC